MTDHESILAYSLDEIERIDIYRREKTISPQFGILGRNGVVAIYTKDPSIRPNVGNDIVLEGLSSINTTIQPIISDNLPALSPQLFWKGQLLPDANGVANFSFDITGDVGDYYIVVDKITPLKKNRIVQLIVLTRKIF